MGCYRVISGEAKTPAQTLITVISCQAKVQANLPPKNEGFGLVNSEGLGDVLRQSPSTKR